jgi:hypothetical protein
MSIRLAAPPSAVIQPLSWKTPVEDEPPQRGTPPRSAETPATSFSVSYWVVANRMARVGVPCRSALARSTSSAAAAPASVLVV